MNTLFRLKDFLHYKHKAGTAFNVHSPFAYAFYTEVVRSKQKIPKALVAVEQIRKTYLHSPEKIFVNDLGTGIFSKPSQRKIRDIMRKYSSSKKDAFLLFRMVQYLKPSTILELGTSLGVSAMSMAMANKNIRLTTIEGCPQTASLAKKNFEKLSLNINLVVGDFDEVLPAILKKLQITGLVFFDGNHTKEATWKYFEGCLKYTNS
ncbi:MAG TPA: class I SAM-dependent methyltransferase [Bacteroidales bacterium]|nr:class I SAM-dependent methyltransferase [Bacteroidales bacterium]